MPPFLYIIARIVSPTGRAGINAVVMRTFFAMGRFFGEEPSSDETQLVNTLNKNITRDQETRAIINHAATKISTDAHHAIANMQEKQHQFSDLLVSLSEQLAQTEHSSDNFQHIILIMRRSLNELADATKDIIAELIDLKSNLTELTQSLLASQAALSAKEHAISEAADKIATSTAMITKRTFHNIHDIQKQSEDIEAQTPQSIELEHLRAQVIQIEKDNQRYRTQIIALTQLVEQQTQVIHSRKDTSNRQVGSNATKHPTFFHEKQTIHSPLQTVINLGSTYS